MLKAPGRYQGSNNDVLFLDAGKYRVIIDGSSTSWNFVIWAHGELGNSFVFNQDLVVNEIAPYKGTIDLPEWTRILTVEAVGPWELELFTR